jgi:hypothetical protein
MAEAPKQPTTQTTPSRSNRKQKLVDAIRQFLDN